MEVCKAPPSHIFSPEGMMPDIIATNGLKFWMPTRFQFFRKKEFLTAKQPTRSEKTFWKKEEVNIRRFCTRLSADRNQAQKLCSNETDWFKIESEVISLKSEHDRIRSCSDKHEDHVHDQKSEQESGVNLRTGMFFKDKS